VACCSWHARGCAGIHAGCWQVVGVGRDRNDRAPAAGQSSLKRNSRGS